MRKIACFISDDFADFEITFLLHRLHRTGNMEVLAMGYTLDPIVSESGLTYLPNTTIADVMQQVDQIEGLIIPGGPIREQKPELTELLQELDRRKKLLAAICNGPQYLARAGILHRHRYTTSCSAKKIQKLGIEDPFPRENMHYQRTLRDGHVITAIGAAFVDFAFAIFDYVDLFKDKPQSRELLYREIMDKWD